MSIYREQQRTCASTELLQELAASEGLTALLRAAELECALADLGHPAAPDSARLCDELARDFVSGARSRPPAIRFMHELPSEIVLRRPEGYAYYGLDPADYARVAARHARSGERALVLGVRSIGTSLSAVFGAALTLAGARVERITVRPGGHPFRRELCLTAAQLQAIERARGGEYFVVDEGPGLSGSTFLAVAEALLCSGVPADRIVLCPSHECDPEKLVAEQASSRWRRFRKLVATPSRALLGGDELSAGAWRERVFASEREWPASFARYERRKFLLGGELHKFEGLPPYDAGPLARSEVLAQAGFAPEVRRAAPGYLRFAWCAGRPAALVDRAQAVPMIASYIAFRARELRALQSDTSALAEMTRVNAAEVLGIELTPETLPLELPVIADGRLLPHEWLVTPGGAWVKVDGVDHGDDHLYPGPVDVAWDLAGAAVEWRLDADGTQALLDRFRYASGHDASGRLAAYERAYLCFRLGVTAMAGRGAPAGELPRLAEDARYYRARLRQLLTSTG
jgi:hypothetical protein